MPDWSKMSMLGRRQDDDTEAPLFRSDMPDPYAASSSSMSPSSFRHDQRHDLASSSTGSLPQLEASEDLPTASALLFEAPEDDNGSVPTLNPSILALRPMSSPGKKGKGRATMVESAGPGHEDHVELPMNTAARRGWLAHQSIFPSSARAPSPLDTSGLTPSPISTDRKLQDTSSPEIPHHQLRNHTIGDRSRSRSGRRSSTTSSSTGSFTDGSYGDDDIESSGDEDSLSDAGFDDPRRLHDPIALGVEGVELPARLEVLQDKMGYWANGRETIAKYNDPLWLALWLFSIVGVLIGLCFVWGATDPTLTPTPSLPEPNTRYRTPFSTLLHMIPLLSVLVLVAVAAPLGFLLLLRKTVRHVLVATAVVIPFMLCVTSWWAFIASFEDDSDIGGSADPGGRWWSSTGLRLFALVPFALAILFGRMVWKRRKRLERTVAVVELSSSFLLDHPPVLLLTPALLMVFAVLSIPYLTLLLRLLLIGYYRHPRENTYIWHVKPYADILIVVVSLLWLWTWVVVKGVGRVVTAAVISEWYFHRNDRDPPATVDLTVAAIHRATGPSLGSICLSSLIVAVMRFLGRVAIELRRALNSRSRMLPIPVDLVAAISPVIVMLSGLLDYVNGYALIYVGVTGEAFWPSAKRAIGLAGRRKGSRLLDYTLIKLLLTLSSTTIALATAVVGYLYAAHALSAASHAPLAALLCGGVPFFAVRACAGVLGDASDALFICLAIDEAIEGDHCTQAKAAFTEEKPSAQSTV